MSDRMRGNKGSHDLTPSPSHCATRPVRQRLSLADEFEDNVDSSELDINNTQSYMEPISQSLVPSAILCPQIDIVPERRLLDMRTDCSFWVAIVVTGVLASPGNDEVNLASGDDGMLFIHIYASY